MSSFDDLICGVRLHSKLSDLHFCYLFKIMATFTPQQEQMRAFQMIIESKPFSGSEFRLMLKYSKLFS